MRLLRDTALATAFWIALLSGTAQAKLFQVGPGDDWTNIEAAQAGDVVEIAPGTYSFRVTLEQMGTAAQPIIIRAQDPNNRPVWDLKGKPVGSWPGSYSGGDQGMGAWQVRGEHYVISGIVFQNCQDVSSAAVRAMGEDSLTLRDCLFAHNTTGISGSTDGLLVEFCELHDNGNTLGRGDSGQNISLGGGSLTLRYSYLHDPLQNWNMTLGTRNALVEYCWIARPATYQAIMDSCEWNCGGTGTSPITQRAVFRGNVLIQGDASMNRVFYMHKKSNSGSYDKTGTVGRMELTLVNNTVIGTRSGGSTTQQLVIMDNDTVETQVVLHNNILVGLDALAVPADPSGSNWSATGTSNWVATGTTVGGGITGSITGSLPGFVNLTALDFRLTSSSPCHNAAALVNGLPTREYYLNEQIKLQFRARPTVKDLGAFELGNTSPPVGPYDNPSPPPDSGLITDAGSIPDAGPSPDAGSIPDAGSSPDAGVSTDAGPPAADGCSCSVSGAPLPGGSHLLVLLAGLLMARTSRRYRRPPRPTRPTQSCPRQH